MIEIMNTVMEQMDHLVGTLKRELGVDNILDAILKLDQRLKEQGELINHLNRQINYLHMIADDNEDKKV